MDHKKEIAQLTETTLSEMYVKIGIDRPNNHEEIAEYIKSDIEDSAGEEPHSGDVSIALRRWIESKSENEK